MQLINELDDAASFNQRGGLAAMGTSLARGAVLVISLWDSLGGGMDWLDGLEGTNSSTPGALRGPCTDAEAVSDSAASVTFSNIKVGDLYTTYPATTAHWTQWYVVRSIVRNMADIISRYSGGVFYTGPTACESPFTCTEINEYYSQCL